MSGGVIHTNVLSNSELLQIAQTFIYFKQKLQPEVQRQNRKWKGNSKSNEEETTRAGGLSGARPSGVQTLRQVKLKTHKHQFFVLSPRGDTENFFSFIGSVRKEQTEGCSQTAGIYSVSDIQR